MRFPVKALAITLSLGAGITMAAFAPAFAQDGRETAARELVAEALTASRTAEIYSDLRQTVRDIWLPIMNDTVAGKIPGAMPTDPTEAAIMKKAVVLFSYGSKAADELDAVLAANREAMIGDASQLIAKHFTADEIGNIRGALRLSATRKGFDAVYTATRAVTGYTYEEAHTAQKFAGWTRDIAARFRSGAVQPQNPTPDRMAKAQGIVTELMRIGHFDEMFADALRFTREVVLKTLPMDQQEALRLQVDQVEFQYNLQKQMLVAAAPAAIASYLNDADLQSLDGIIRTPAIAKAFSLVFDAERAFTKFTVQDIATARTYVEELEKNGKIRERTDEEKQAFEADYQALSAKWGDKLFNSVSPQTREGLMKAFAEIEALPLPGIPAKPL